MSEWKIVAPPTSLRQNVLHLAKSGPELAVSVM